MTSVVRNKQRALSAVFKRAGEFVDETQKSEFMMVLNISLALPTERSIPCQFELCLIL